MDENHSEAKDILRKRILEEKHNLVTTENSDSSENKPDSVFQSHKMNPLDDNITLFHSEEDSLSDFEAKEPAKNSVFSSEHTSLHPKSLFLNRQKKQQYESPAMEDLSGKNEKDREISKIDTFEPQADSIDSTNSADVVDSSDAAFPLFLSFKANDSMQTVSEGVREKYSDRSDNALNVTANSDTEDNQKSQDPESPVQSDNHMDHIDTNYSEIGIPIFKPYDSAYDESLTPKYDIPEIFSNNEKSSGNTSSKAGSTPAVPSPTVRPGASYTAAQQMGNIVPLAQREIKTRRSRTQSHKPLLILLLLITIFVAVFSFWSNFRFDDAFANWFGSAAGTASTTPTTSTSSAAAAMETSKETSKETTKATTAQTKPKPTSTPAPTQETAAAETTITTSAAKIPSAMIPSGFSTSITDGKSNGDTATFNILFKNLGTSDVSLYDGVEFITIAFTTSNTKITEVTSPDFTFTADPDKSNYFIGTPVSTDVIIKKETKTVAVSAKSGGSDIGKYSVKYYVKCYS